MKTPMNHKEAAEYLKEFRGKSTEGLREDLMHAQDWAMEVGAGKLHTSRILEGVIQNELKGRGA